MVSLLDIAPATVGKTIGTGDAQVTVDLHGVSALGIAKLLGLFPQLRALMTGQEVEFSAAQLATLAPEALAAIIALGAAPIADFDKASAAAAALALPDQLTLVQGVLEVTLPGGVGPFMERLAALADGLGVTVPPSEAPGTK